MWLCRDQHADTPTYVAIKILMARETGINKVDFASGYLYRKVDSALGAQYTVPLLNQFESESSNGTHICLVYPVLGCTVNHARFIFDKAANAAGILRGICQQVVEAVAALHTNGICHAGKHSSRYFHKLH